MELTIGSKIVENNLIRLLTSASRRDVSSFTKLSLAKSHYQELPDEIENTILFSLA